MIEKTSSNLANKTEWVCGYLKRINWVIPKSKLTYTSYIFRSVSHIGIPASSTNMTNSNPVDNRRMSAQDVSSGKILTFKKKYIYSPFIIKAVFCMIFAWVNFRYCFSWGLAWKLAEKIMKIYYKLTVCKILKSCFNYVWT